MTKIDIKNNLQDFSQNNLLENSLKLFSTLGYTTKRQYAISSLDEFKSRFLTSSFNEEKLLFSEWRNAQFLFELQANDLNSEETTISTEIIDNKAIETYWFFAIELKDGNYTKKQLSEITREINKQRPIPTFILFKYADKLTFSIIDRRLNKKDDNKDVLEKVVLIKDINLNNPHRAHIDILSDISFENIKDKFNLSNFVELHLNWLKALSVSELNKRFYTELSNWFFWTMDTCQLSKNNTVKDNVMFGIRMVTRIIFDWFIKEKGLVSEKVFDKQTYLDLLKPEYKEQGDLYYKVILQNLFFGCLSKPMDRREFRSEDRFQGKNTGYDVNNLFRYAKYLNNPQDIVNMFKDIPFLNGGLFECTDDKRNGKYVDCFTDNDSRNFLKISDDIFFLEDEKIVDLSSHFDGNSNYKNVKVRGLFSILNSYKFTIDETTPVEEEIALDPELLGRVFENLLAAHNPETKTTARKSTGSYYTPREIVDYMSEKTLSSYLKVKLDNLKIDNIDEKIQELMSYSETHSFNDFETEELIKAVNEVKILDPACGSGAFPMGLLHKLVHILSKLDPHNLKWKESQIEKANQIDDLEAREEAINIIEKQFNDNEMDYSRKLYLIQNCIFGVDIQPMATQISRLRFFISLIVDEKPNKSKPNMGILALPNLETKFVAANTLIDIPQNNLFSTFPTLVELREELEKVRAMHFRANSSQRKSYIQNRDNEIRLRIKQEAITLGATFESAAKIAEWSPYDKDHSSDWFNPKWMFNVDKFDIVIGNPPYVDSEEMTRTLAKERELYANKFKSAKGNWDLFIVFCEQSLLLGKENSINSFIIPNKILAAKYSEEIRKIFKTKNIIEIRDYSRVKVFKEAAVYPIVYVLNNNENLKQDVIMAKMNEDFEVANQNIIKQEIFYNDILWDKYFQDDDSVKVLVKVSQNRKLSQYGDFLITAAATVNEAYQIKEVLQDSADYDNSNYFKFVNSGTIDKYKILWGIKPMQYIKGRYENPIVSRNDIGSINGVRLRQASSPKIIIASMTKEIEAYYDNSECLAAKSTTIICGEENNLKYLTGLLNSKLLSWWYKINYNSLKMSGEALGFGSNEVGSIPIIIADENIKNKLINLVEKVIHLYRQDNYLENNDIKVHENEINIIVYKIYGLTYSEVKTVDPNFSMSEQEYNNYQI